MTPRVRARRDPAGARRTAEGVFRVLRLVGSRYDFAMASSLVEHRTANSAELGSIPKSFPPSPEGYIPLEAGSFPADPEATADGEASGANALRRGGYRPHAMAEPGHRHGRASSDARSWTQPGADGGARGLKSRPAIGPWAAAGDLASDNFTLLIKFYSGKTSAAKSL